MQQHKMNGQKFHRQNCTICTVLCHVGYMHWLKQRAGTQNIRFRVLEYMVLVIFLAPPL